MDIVKLIREKDMLGKTLGIEILEAGPGYAKTRLVLDQRHLNGVGTAHGGAIFSLADIAFAAASNSYGIVAMGISVSISYFKAVTEGILTAEAREMALNHKLATYLIDIKTGEGEAVALFQGTVYRKSSRHGAAE